MSVLLAKLPSFAIEERDERGARAGEPLLVADEVAGGVRDAVSMSNGPVRLRRPARGIRAVLRQLVPTRGGVSFGPPKSKRSRRTIALDAETVAALREHREAQLLERAFADDAYTDSDLVFCDELGGTIYPQRLGETFLRQRKAAGLTTGTLHIQRHTHATLRSRTVFRCTSSQHGSATGPKRCCASMHTCCHSRTCRQPSRSQACLRQSERRSLVMDEQSQHQIAEYANRLSADGRHGDISELVLDLARALDESADAERPALFARREFSRIHKQARDFLEGAE
jgi:hypothetical protein